MRNFIHSLASTSLSTIGNSLLIGSAALVGLCGVGLTALYLIKYVDRQSPEIIELQCAVGVDRPECVDYQKELDDLSAQREALAKELAALKGKLGNLKRIEENVDSVTLFDMTDIPDSNLTITVGTRYSKLLEPTLTPEYFCYISLADTGGIDRNLYIRNTNGDIQLNDQVLRDTGVSGGMLRFSRDKCKPYLIGGE